MNNDNFTILPKWLWLYFPVILVIFQYLASNVLQYENYNRVFATELGIIENLTVIISLIALATGIRILTVSRFFPFAHFKIIIFLLVAGCFYTIGEEISWGQHYLNWNTPELLKEINQQKETNLHNIHNIFGVVPKIFLEWTIYIGGIFIALKVTLQNIHYRPGNNWRYWFMPSIVIFPAALIAFILRIFDRIENWFDLDFVVDWDETHELLLMFVIMLYMMTISRKLFSYQQESAKTVGSVHFSKEQMERKNTSI